jgi:hypothetical protein
VAFLTKPFFIVMHYDLDESWIRQTGTETTARFLETQWLASAEER